MEVQSSATMPPAKCKDPCHKCKYPSDDCKQNKVIGMNPSNYKYIAISISCPQTTLLLNLQRAKHDVDKVENETMSYNSTAVQLSHAVSVRLPCHDCLGSQLHPASQRCGHTTKLKIG
jgi:hypothetical protein